ncbi:MAG: UDP-N-acetylmuramate dehydrogenase [Spirochaetaceae bacterium]
MDINVEKNAEKINIRGNLLLREPMSRHTTFGIGGPADIFAVPEDREDLRKLISCAAREKTPLHIIGEGANILAADAGVRGIVAHTGKIADISIEGTTLTAEAGAPISEVSAQAAEHNLSGLEFIYKMPGSTGGALWMNARCYGSSISEHTRWIEYFEEGGEVQRMHLPHPDYGYKTSPFQGSDKTICRACFTLEKGDRTKITREMSRVYRDRKEKGHFNYPSAGSVFKNNRSFGRPTGAILDELGLKGMRRGDAQIAPFHANIIINLGNATARDVYALMEEARIRAWELLRIKLEPELQCMGDWGEPL